MVFALGVISGATWYFLTPMERWRFRRAAAAGIKQFRRLFDEWQTTDPLTDVLRERTRWVIVVPALVVACVVMYVKYLFDTAVLTQPERLVSWGANFAPRTTNQEWWRLAASACVHGSILSLAVNVGALLTAGRVLERLVGPLTFAAVYLASAVLSAVACLWLSPVGVTTGASGAIFGMYGLLLACWMWGTFQRATTTVRLTTVKRIAIPAAIFVLYHLASGDLPVRAEVAGLVVGFGSGLALTRNAAVQKPANKRLAMAVLASAFFTIVFAEPLRGLTDARPEIARVIQSEERAVAMYDAAVAKFRRGWVTGRELVTLIDKTIVPDLEVAIRRVGALARVPQEHREMVTTAQKYLRLLEDAWRFRARAVSKSNGAMLREADRREQMARAAYGELLNASSRTASPPAK